MSLSDWGTSPVLADARLTGQITTLTIQATRTEHLSLLPLVKQGQINGTLW